MKLHQVLRLLVVAFGCTGVRTPAASPPEHRPDYILDLRKFGFEELKDKHWPWLQVAPTNSTIFVDDDTLAVSFFVRNPTPGLSVRGGISGGAYLFQTAFVDAKSGKVLRSFQWSNAGRGCGLFAAPGGGFVVWHDLELSLHQPDGTVVKSLRLDAKSFPRAVSLTQSSGGGTLFATRFDRDGNHVLVVRTTDLQIVTWLELPGYFEGAGSDSSFAYLRDHPGTGMPPKMDLFLRPLADDARATVPVRIFTTSDQGCRSISFLDERTLAISGACHSLTILSTSGDVLYQHRFDMALTGVAHPCRNCSLVASGTYVVSGGSEALDISPKSTVRSTLLLDRITRHLLELPRRERIKYTGGTALSPHGCLLAIQTDWHVEIYRTCDSPIAQQLNGGG